MKVEHTPTPRERSRPHIDDFKPSVTAAERLLLGVIAFFLVLFAFSMAGYLWGRFA